MSESEENSFRNDRRFHVGFCAGLAVFIALNFASYFFNASPDAAAKLGQPTSHKIGVPRVFWVEDRIGLAVRLYNPNQRFKPFESEFYWGAFLVDVVLACAISVGMGQWYQKRGKPRAAASEPRSSTPTTP